MKCLEEIKETMNHKMFKIEISIEPIIQEAAIEHLKK